MDVISPRGRRVALEGITLGEISQRKTEPVCCHIDVGSGKAKLTETESGMEVARGQGE